MPVDDVLTLLLLAVLVQIPFFFAAMACTWLVHEWHLHRWSRLKGRAWATGTFWARTVWDHPGRFFPSYLLLFIAFLALFQMPAVALQDARGASLMGALLGLAWALGYGLALFALGYAALRVRLRGHMA